MLLFRRRIIACALPPDVCDPQVDLLDRMDYSIGNSAGPSSPFSTRIMNAMADRHPDIRLGILDRVLNQGDVVALARRIDEGRSIIRGLDFGVQTAANPAQSSADPGLIGRISYHSP